jgi:hypothetical protein
MTTNAPGAPVEDSGSLPMSRPRRLALVLGATAVLMSLTGIGLSAVQHAAVAVPAITSSEAVTPAAAGLTMPSGAPLPNLKKIVAQAGVVAAEGSGLEQEHSGADHRRDARNGERD